MFRIHTGRMAAMLGLLSTTALPQTALAASYLNVDKNRANTQYSASLAEMTQAETSRSTRTLDWRQPSTDLIFELPPAQKTTSIVLTLSADPLTRVARNVPLHVQLNHGEPIPILSQGNGFEARIPLDLGRLRRHRNTLRITYPTPEGADCLSPADGAWSIDLAQSSLRIGGLARDRDLTLTEVSKFLGHPALSPKRVGLIAQGPEAADMQALAAQGLALRTPHIPKFSVTKSGADFNVVMVRRDKLWRVTNDSKVLDTTGPRIFVTGRKRKELIFTADTDAEILDLLKVFATRELPYSRKSNTNKGQMLLQERLDSNRNIIENKTRLADLTFSPNGANPDEQSYKFSLKDPTISQGQLLLRLSKTQDLENNSRLRVSLNGKTLGATYLDKKRKSVLFDLKSGDFVKASNILTLTPELSAKAAFTCPSLTYYNPGYSVGYGSRLMLKEDAPSTVTNLAQLSSTGGLFAKQESYIVLPRQNRDFQAALSVLGRMAKTAGQGFTQADYTRTSNVAKDKHILIIGPHEMVKGHLSGAPKALREALSGRASAGDNLLQAEYGKSASLNDDSSGVIQAAAQSNPIKINRGGVAALYSASPGRLTGVITASPGASFSYASQNIIKPDHWTALKGGVVRWTSSSVIMTQMAQSNSGFPAPATPFKFKLPEIDLSFLETLHFHYSDIDWPEFELPSVNLPEINWPRFARPSTAANLDVDKVQNEYSQERQIPAKIIAAAPRLKPGINPARQNISTAALRGPFQFTAPASQPVSIFHKFGETTKAKWTTVQTLAKKKDSLLQRRALAEITEVKPIREPNIQTPDRTFKTFLADKLPANGLVKLGDRTVSIYGVMLIFIFGWLLLFISFTRPSSRSREPQQNSPEHKSI
jgi:hypothetical protein